MVVALVVLVCYDHLHEVVGSNLDLYHPLWVAHDGLHEMVGGSSHRNRHLLHLGLGNPVIAIEYNNFNNWLFSFSQITFGCLLMNVYFL